MYLGGINDNNGGQLIKDKVAVLGDNTKVKLIAPDGFTGYPDLDKLPEAQGMYMTFAGLSIDQLLKRGRRRREVRSTPTRRSTADRRRLELRRSTAWRPCRSILRRIEKSDGTRKGVTDAVFGGSGHHDPGRRVGASARRSRSTRRRGDVNAKDITVELIKDNQETFLKAQSVELRPTTGPGGRTSRPGPLLPSAP